MVMLPFISRTFLSSFGSAILPLPMGIHRRKAPLFACLPAHCGFFFFFFCCTQLAFQVPWLLLYKLAFILWWQVCCSQTVPKKTIHWHKQCHPRISTGNTIQIHSSKSSWSTLISFFFQLSPPKVTICMLKCGWEFEGFLLSFFCMPSFLKQSKNIFIFPASLN